MQNKALRVLKINASARIKNSVSRELSDFVIEKLMADNNQLIVMERQLDNLPFVSETMTEAMFTSDQKRTSVMQDSLTTSNMLVAELKSVDVLVIGLPIYNFGIPANLKAYIDQVTRAGETFRFSNDGPIGLIQNIKAFVIISSAGTEMNSAEDFATSYMRFILKFIGITEIHFVDATGLRQKNINQVKSKFIESFSEQRMEAA